MEPGAERLPDDFTVDGGAYEAAIGTIDDPDAALGTEPGPGHLKTPTSMLPFTLGQAAPATLRGFVFRCIGG